MEEYQINSPEEMMALGGRLAEEFSTGGVLALVGDLGAGKTHLVKGLARALGHEEGTSPTFSLVNEYVGTVNEQRVPVYHFDLYRMKREEEAWEIGWGEYLEREGVVVAEWADLFPELFPPETVWIKIEHDEEKRRVSVIRPT